MGLVGKLAAVAKAEAASCVCDIVGAGCTTAVAQAAEQSSSVTYFFQFYVISCSDYECVAEI